LRELDKPGLSMKDLRRQEYSNGANMKGQHLEAGGRRIKANRGP
jgi:hypothetical protein